MTENYVFKIYKGINYVYKIIYATEVDFIHTRIKYETIYEELREFAEVRLVITYEKIFKDSIGKLTSFQALKKLESLSTSNGYKEYNQNENRFPNATIAFLGICNI